MCDPIFSVVILNFNKSIDLCRNLERLSVIISSQDELIVVDNNSTDDSVQMVQSNFPNVNLIINEINLGAAEGRNIGLRKAKGKYIIILDDDSLPPKNIFSETKRLFENYPEVGILAYWIKSMPSGNICTQYKSTKLCSFWECGAAFRRELIQRIGYIDSNLFFGAEGIDTSLRMLDIGYITRNTPEVTIEHFVKKHSREETIRRHTFWITGWTLFYWKSFPFYYSLIFCFRLYFSFLIAGLRNKSLISFCNAFRQLTGYFPYLVKNRRIVSPSTISFYINPKSEPEHYNMPLFYKFSRFLNNKYLKVHSD